MTVYCIKSQCGAVKIGAAKDVQRRLDNLQIGSPLALEIVGVLPGDEVLERALHERFADRRTRGEWFQDSDGAIAAEFLPYVPPQRGPQGMEPATTIITLCGGFRAVADLTGRDVTRVHRWTYPKEKGGTDGLIPWDAAQTLMTAARERGLPLDPSHFFPLAEQEGDAA